jgi:hypothetical protein
MHRAFGSTKNGSLPAYGAVGEMATYLGNLPQVNMRGLGATGMPDMKPTIDGEVLDTVEFGSKYGWCAVYIIGRAKSKSDGSSGYTEKFIVQYVCPSQKMARTVGSYATLAEAKTSASNIQQTLRNTGSTSSINGFGGYSSLGAVGLQSPSFIMAAVAAMYIGADFPGARPIATQIGKFLREPKEAIQTGLLVTGFLGFSVYLMSTGGGGQ